MLWLQFGTESFELKSTPEHSLKLNLIKMQTKRYKDNVNVKLISIYVLWFNVCMWMKFWFPIFHMRNAIFYWI